MKSDEIEHYNAKEIMDKWRKIIESMLENTDNQLLEQTKSLEIDGTDLQIESYHNQEFRVQKQHINIERIRGEEE